jgi:RimJ/RimL family protein N-acetyltransferase
MFALSLEQAAALRSLFLPDRPVPLVGLHVLNTGHGTCYVDRWPAPRAILVESGRNYALVGDPSALAPADLQARIEVGYVDTPERFDALLQAAFPSLTLWARVILDMPMHRAPLDPPPGAIIRRLGAGDADDIDRLDPKLAWIASTWGGPAGLAASGYAWGAFANGQLVAVASSFFVGDRYEDIAVVTDPAHRGLGLSTACAAALCGDIHHRGHEPTWTTATDNHASLRVAEKLGFVVQHHDRLVVIGGV